MRVLLALLLGAVAVATATQRSFKGHSVLRTQALTATQALTLKRLEDGGHYDFWASARPGGRADIMSDISRMPQLKKYLGRRHIDFSVMVPDVEELVQKTRSNKTASAKPKGSMDWDSYHDHNELNDWIDGLAAEDSTDKITTVSIGESYEGRDMRVLKIEEAGTSKPIVWIEAGIHAREWIAPAMATYLINEILTDDEGFLAKLNFHILPSANPDGYTYSIDHDRMWRKTRSDTGSVLGCKGVDPNRNWGFHFGESGTSTNKCSETYLGPEAFSEPETDNIRKYVQGLDETPILAHCLHSYSQLWLYPYGYAYNAYPDNVDEIKQLAEDAADALFAVHGTVFDPINSAELYPAAGASDDWYKGVLGARFSYTSELRDTGHYGFVLPEDQIKPSGEELWAAFKVVFNKMIELSK